MNEPADYLEFMRQSAERIAHARPTAVNLMHMVDAAMEIVEEEAVSGSSPVVIADKLYEFTKQLIVEDEDANRKMGEKDRACSPIAMPVVWQRRSSEPRLA